MEFGFDDVTLKLRDNLLAFMDEKIYPAEPVFAEQLAAQSDPWAWSQVPILAELRAEARDRGLWNLFLPGEHGAGLTNLQYAPLAEITGRSLTLAPPALNCSAPDTGNMEVLAQFGTEEQRKTWLQPLLDGQIRSSFAMTEPDVASSDATNISTRIVRDGDSYVINGAKTFITGGANAALVLTVARTSPPSPQNRRSGLSILVVEKGAPGFSVGTNLKKIGLKAQDTTELFYDDVRLPTANLLGEEGKAFEYLTRNLAQERLTIAVAAMSAAATALDLTVDYVRERNVFGQPLSSFQNTKFVLADCATKVEAGHAMVDRALSAHERSDLSVADAAKAKLFSTEIQGAVIDQCMQLFGGYGYMLEYPIARLYSDARVTRVYGGTSEVIKTIIAKDLGL